MEVVLPKLSDDEALAILLSSLRGKQYAVSREQLKGYDVYLPSLVYVYSLATHQKSLRDCGQDQPPGANTYNTLVNSEPFYAAASVLVRRGVLFPSWVYLHKNVEANPIIGAGFNLTDYGRSWIKGLSEYDCVPSEQTQFGKLLASHAARLGAGYKVRSSEALRSYQAQTFLACCAMCGAAAESILLQLAIGKIRNEEEVLTKYRTARGRGYLESLLSAKQNSHIQSQLPTFTALLNHWRDEAAHGQDSEIDEEEAFLSLILLLRFARFADERWDELTA